MLRSSERGAVRRRSSFSMIGGSRGLRQTRAAAGVRAPAAARRVAARNRGAGAASGRTTPLCPDPGRTRRPRPAISHIPLSPDLPLSPISRRDVGLGLLSPAGVGCLPPAGVGCLPPAGVGCLPPAGVGCLPPAGGGRLPPAVPDPGRELRASGPSVSGRHGLPAPHRGGSRPWHWPWACYIPVVPRCSATDVPMCGSGA
jgi:hypothetical protein